MCHWYLGLYLLADAVLIIFFFFVCTLYLTKQLMASGASQIVIFILCEHTAGANGLANYPVYGQKKTFYFSFASIKKMHIDKELFIN